MDRGAWWAAVHGGPKESDTKSRDMTGQLSTGTARVPSKLLTQKSCTVAQEHYPHFTGGHAQAQSNAMTHPGARVQFPPQCPAAVSNTH